MITYIKGKLVEKNPAYLVIETPGGVAYYIHISLNTFSKLGDAEEIRIFTHYVIKEDAHALYGFFDETERTLFRLLISVNGIGPNTACIILSALSPNELVAAISGEDAKTIQSIKGIGTKTAQRLILDLKDKTAKMQTGVDKIPGTYNNNKNEALSALVSLGFAKNAADGVLDKILKSEGTELSIEDLIKKALKLL